MENTSLLTALATVIVAVIGAVVSCFTFTYGKIHEKKVELRKIKENQYIDFLTFLAKAKVSNTKEVETELTIKVQTIFLIGNKNVQLALSDFLKCFTGEIKEDQSKKYGKLIQEMKLDLYGKRWKFTCKGYNSIDDINFTVFNSH